MIHFVPIIMYKRRDLRFFLTFPFFLIRWLKNIYLNSHSFISINNCNPWLSLILIYKLCCVLAPDQLFYSQVGRLKNCLLSSFFTKKAAEKYRGLQGSKNRPWWFGWMGIDSTRYTTTTNQRFTRSCNKMKAQLQSRRSKITRTK